MAWLLPESRIRGPDTVAQFSMPHHVDSVLAAIPSPPEGERVRVRGKASLSLKWEEPRQRHPATYQHLDQGRSEEHEPECASRSQESREEESAREQRRGKNPERRYRGPGIVSGAFGFVLYGHGDH